MVSPLERPVTLTAIDPVLREYTIEYAPILVLNPDEDLEICAERTGDGRVEMPAAASAVRVKDVIRRRTGRLPSVRVRIVVSWFAFPFPDSTSPRNHS